MDPVRAAQPTADKLRREVRALRDGEASSINDRQCVALSGRIAIEVAKWRTGGDDSSPRPPLSPTTTESARLPRS